MANHAPEVLLDVSISLATAILANPTTDVTQPIADLAVAHAQALLDACHEKANTETDHH